MSEVHLPLARQLDLVFREVNEELASLDSGTLFIQIRNNVIGKFGVRHNPIEGRAGEIEELGNGLNEQQRYAFRKMAIKSLKHKKNWTHGEIMFDFVLKKGVLYTSVQLESNYNMANLLQKADLIT